jgi:SAM-dependent methyltransferase
MSHPPKPAAYYAVDNEVLGRAVPAGARRILEVGCGEGRRGAALKQQDGRRVVYGIEREPAAAARAAGRLDQVFALDVENDELPLEPGTLDCVLYGDVLAHLRDPGAVLRHHRRLLAPGGVVLCAVPNVQHHAVLTALLRGDVPCGPAATPGVRHLHVFTYASFFKLLLDAGFVPELLDAVSVPGDPALLAAAEPMLRHLGLHAGRTRRYLDACQYLFRGTPLVAEEAEPSAEPPLSIVACVSDEAVLRDNLLSSPCLAPGSPHEVLLVRCARSAAEGLNQGLDRARHAAVVCVHQDVYLPQGWPRRVAAQLARAERAFGPVGVAGVYGVSLQRGEVRRAGRLVDRDRLLSEPPGLPAPVETLDELLLVLPNPSSLRFDPALGFHFYGADVCLAARRQGLAAAVLDAPCMHHSRSVGLPAEFFASGRAFARKWAAHLPVATACAVVDGRWLAESGPPEAAAPAAPAPTGDSSGRSPDPGPRVTSAGRDGDHLGGGVREGAPTRTWTS